MKATIGDSFARRDGPLENSYPRNAAPTASTPSSGTPWTWTAYTQVVASTSADFVASGVDIKFKCTINTGGNTGSIAYSGNIEVALAIGPAGSEVDFAVISEAFEGSISNPATSAPFSASVAGWGRHIPIAPKLIPAGSRIAIRTRSSLEANATPGGFPGVSLYITGYDGGAAPAEVPTYTLRGNQTGIQKGASKVAPSGSVLTVTAGNAAFGSWYEIIASAASELLLQGVSLASTDGITSSHAAILEVGTGAAGSEVTRARIWIPGMNVSPQAYAAGTFLMPRPLLIKPGERIAVRAYGFAAPGRTFDTQWLYEQH